MKKNNSRRQFIKLSAAGSAGLLTMGGTASQWVMKKELENDGKKKWNLLFLWTDQQRYDTMEAYGNHKIKTPNLNKLANQSLVFKTAYVSQPVSTPSRSTIMTGLYPHTNGCTANNIPLKKETPCLPELINDSDYKTAYMGKWHLGDELYAQHGFNEWVSMSDGYNNYFSDGKDRMKKSTYHHWLIDKGYEPDIKNDPYGERFSRGAAARLPIEHSKPMFLKEHAIKFLEENKDHPFILYVNYLEPHNPYFGSLDDLHDPGEVTVPENFNDLIDETENLRLQIKQYKNKDEHSKDEETLRKLIAKYWGLVSLVDKSVGSILDKLDEAIS
ncbi:MAG: sulfatase-like hydrolase/transferase [bacterium]